MSECAAQKPARLSLTTSSTALISFFIPSSRSHHGLGSLALAILDQSGDFLREFAQERVELVILLIRTEIRQHQSESPAALAFLQKQKSAGMRSVIGGKKPFLFLRREMAN